ncbi:hypothetical protein U1701_11890 [Sphingomonas sp. PB2P19]|uniref:hypothetical protein n=1 Tax=Sphingomonas rhamnosi TaxID=3096156 RepID=UPI002FCBDEAC
MDISLISPAIHRWLSRAGVARLATVAVAVSVAVASPAAASDFDLAGPVLRASVARGGVTLPLSQVPDLATGDRITVAVELPRQQGARYRLVLAFLRGATNPPPKDWLFEAESWKPKKATIVAVVPEGAQQVLALLVPDTKGAVDAVSGAIRGKPGAFVRASQELNQAMLGSARLSAFAEALRQRDAAGAAAVSPQLATTLGVKPDPACLQRQPDTRAGCLTQGSNVAVFADSQTNSIAQTLAGAPADIALQLSGTPQGGYGYYSPYIGVVRDLARILGAFQSAQLQFIPALSVQRGATTELLLNTVPSFRKPQSVLVAALPPVAPPALPPVEATERRALCAYTPNLLLAVAGAPLLFATDYARQVALRVRGKDGQTLEFPVVADAAQGGYVVATMATPATLGPGATGTLHGLWGFTPFEGPSFRLAGTTDAAWRLADTTPLVVGRDTPVTLVGGAAACVAEVSLERDGARTPMTIAEQEGDRLALKVPLTGIAPGPVTLLVRSYGADQPQRLTLRALSEGSRLTSFDLHAGDREGVLVGTRLDQVATLTLGGVTFRPQTLGRAGLADRLVMTTDEGAVGALRPGQQDQATVTLADGRTVPLKTRIAAARPAASLIAKSVEPAGAVAVPISLGAPDAVPNSAKLSFSIRAQGGTRFTADTKVEIRALDPAVAKTLPVRLQDTAVAIATFVPEEALGGSAHGPLTYRVVENGVAGDWMPLATLVRLPTLTAFACAGESCVLSGGDLFLLQSVSTGASGVPAIGVPDGFAGTTIPVPRAPSGRLLLQLRDAPNAAASIGYPR